MPTAPNLILRLSSGIIILAILAAASARDIPPVRAAGEGLWIAAGSMSVARERPTATLLQDGSVLLVGGDNSLTNYVPAVELYSPATDTWSTAAPLAAGRSFHTATLLPNGKVLVVGGFGGSPATNLASAELYDPASNTWSSANSLTTPRRAHTATLLPNGKVLIAGGMGGTPEDYLKSAELYTPSTNSWATAAAMAHVRQYHTATLTAGIVLVAGGFDGDYVATAERYDPAANTWSPAHALGTARRLHTATLLANGDVLVAGGGGPAAYLATAERYNAATDNWTPTGDLAEARAGHAATLLDDGRVLVEGGVNAAATLATAELFDPGTNAWSSEGTLAAARARQAAVLLNDGGVLVSGGNAAGYLNSAELWDEDTDADGVPNRHEIATGCTGFPVSAYAGPLAQMTKPCNPDTDGDGFLDKPAAAFEVVNLDPNVDNCPVMANPAQLDTDAANGLVARPGADVSGDTCDPDWDGDGYTNAAEVARSKDPLVYCTMMRADVDGDGVVSILDITVVGQNFIRTIPPAPERSNQDNGLSISILDLAVMSGVFLQHVSDCP